MSRHKWLLPVLVAVMMATSTVVYAGTPARMPGARTAANRVLEVQRTDPEYSGTWYWIVGDTDNAPNLTGVTALGLLEAYKDTKDASYISAAKNAATYIMTHLGSGATGAQHSPRLTGPDVIFLHRLSEVTGITEYKTRATAEWATLKASKGWTKASDIEDAFKTLNRHSAWDVAFFLEAAHLSGDTAFADQAAVLLANTEDPFFYDSSDPDVWYALNVSAATRVLVQYGYAKQYNGQVVYLLKQLVGLIDSEGGIVGGYAQDTAYAVMAFASAGGTARQYANSLARWLTTHQGAAGGWVEPDESEYPESDGEALRAIATTIGNNVTLKGFDGKAVRVNSSWRRSAGRVTPFGK